MGHPDVNTFPEGVMRTEKGHVPSFRRGSDYLTVFEVVFAVFLGGVAFRLLTLGD